MLDLFVLPGAPYYALALAGLMVAAYALTRLGAARLALVGVREQPTPTDLTRRMLVGQAGGALTAAVLVVMVVAQGAAGFDRMLLLTGAAACYLYGGIVYPRQPLVAAERERRVLRRLTPGLIAYIRVAMAGREAPTELLERYVERPRPRIMPMQAAVVEALNLMDERRVRPFEALRIVARARGCRELIDLAEQLAQAEAQGADVVGVLEQQELTLQAILRDEFMRMTRRRSLYLIMLVAFSLVVGIVGNILFVMSGGGSLLMNLGAS